MDGWKQVSFSVNSAQNYANKIAEIVEDGKGDEILNKLSALSVVTASIIHAFYKKYKLKEKDYLEICALKDLADSDKILLNHSRTNFSHYINVPKLDYEQT